MKLILLAIFASLGAPSEAQLRQVGASDVSVRQYPFVAALTYTRQLAGNGAIIASRWVLTSASAVYATPDSEYDVAVGVDHLDARDGKWYQFVGWDYNVALVLVRGDIQTGDTIQPIGLGTSVPETLEVKMVSYGKNNEGTTHLQEATYTLISDNVDCVGLLDEPVAKEVIWQKHGFCLIPPPGTEQGQWYNDAGAPMVASGELYALFAFSENEGGTNVGSVATRVSSFAGWIESTMANNN
uniref:Peptidase S1 domain-containing protein n=1 Tax=Anopheles dirus TaxID=7168 RepID=A0A182NJK4_9DIPT